MKNVSNYADLLVNVHNLLTFPSNSVELRIFNIYGNSDTKLRRIGGARLNCMSPCFFVALIS